MAEKEKEYAYDGHVHGKSRILDFEEFNKQVKDSNGKTAEPSKKDKDLFFGMKKIKASKMFSKNNPFFYKAINMKDDPSEEAETGGADNDGGGPTAAASVAVPFAQGM